MFGSRILLDSEWVSTFEGLHFSQANQMAKKVAVSGILHQMEIELKGESGILLSSKA